MTSSWDIGNDDDADDSYEPEAARVGADDDRRFSDQARRAYITLLNTRFVSRARNRAAWEGLIAWEDEIRARLDELYLELIMDRDAEVAFKRQQDGDDLPRVLRREKSLSRDASFVLLFLRRECAFADSADGPVVVTREQIGEFLRAFRQDGDLDDARFGRRVNAAIQALTKPLQLLTPDPAADYLFTISPVVVPLVGADEILRLEAAFRQAADAADTSDSADEGNEDATDTADGDFAEDEAADLDDTDSVADGPDDDEEPTS